MAVVILSVSVTVLIESLTAAYKTTVINADYVQAIILMENQMALLTRTPFLEKNLSTSTKLKPPYDRFDYSEKAVKSVLDPTGQMQDIHVAVQWKSGRKDNTFSLETSLLKPSDDKP